MVAAKGFCQDHLNVMPVKSEVGFVTYEKSTLSRLSTAQSLTASPSKQLHPEAPSTVTEDNERLKQQTIQPANYVRVTAIGAFNYLRSNIEFSNRANPAALVLCYNYCDTCKIYFCRVEELTRGTGAASMRDGMPLYEYLSTYNYAAPTIRLLGFLRQFRFHETDINVILAVSLCYIKSMESAQLMPLLKQMLVWFGVSNVVYFLCFLAHAFTMDDAVPLRYWREMLADRMMNQANVNKCVRNLLKIRKYRLSVDVFTFDGFRRTLTSQA